MADTIAVGVFPNAWDPLLQLPHHSVIVHGVVRDEETELLSRESVWFYGFDEAVGNVDARVPIV